MPRILIALALALVLATGPALAQSGPTLHTEVSEEYGRYLVGPNGRPVYAFVTDARASDELPPLQSCLRRCRRDWPPVTVAGEPEVGEWLEPDLAAVLETEELRVLVYDSRPLFYFHKDTSETEPQGHGIHTYGGWWQLVAPSGTPITTGILPDPDG